MTDKDKQREQTRSRVSRFRDRIRIRRQQEETKVQKNKEQKRTSILQTLRQLPSKTKSLFYGVAVFSKEEPVDMNKYFGRCIYDNSIVEPKFTNQLTKTGICEFCSRYKVTSPEEAIFLRYFIDHLINVQGRISGTEGEYNQYRVTHWDLTSGQMEILKQVRTNWKCTYCKKKDNPYWKTNCIKCGKPRQREAIQ